MEGNYEKVMGILLTVLFYGLAQILPGLVLGSHLLGDMSKMQTAQTMIIMQVSIFIIVALLIIFMQATIKNPTQLEQGHKEPKRYISRLGSIRILYCDDLPVHYQYNFICHQWKSPKKSKHRKVNGYC